jgi:hypothetical protein
MQGPTGPKGTISKPRGLKPGAVNVQRKRGAATSALRPGELMNANAFPANAIAKSAIQRRPNSYGTDKRRNIQQAVRDLGKYGPNVEVRKVSRPRSVAIADTRTVTDPKTGKSHSVITINTANQYWANPVKEAREMRRSGFHSTLRPGAVIFHELGHAKTMKTNSPKNGFYAQSKKVGRYAGFTRDEFMAETYAGRRAGQRYSPDVMRAYREVQGLSPKPAARRRSRVRRKP